MSRVVEGLRSAAERSGAARSDGELLTQFLALRDEVALAELVQRHAPMVWGVCCRHLRNPQEAEDAFQATFLVFVRKASSVRPRDRVANWLYGVARQTAVRLRAALAKRGGREVQMSAMPEFGSGEAPDREILSRLDSELSRLPERFRALIVLCYLEGRTRKEVARQLGCPEGTVASGLARARGLLAKRLTRPGLAVSGGTVAATLADAAASASVPQTLVHSTVLSATFFAAGKAAGLISGPVAALSQGVLKTMFLKKILATAVAVLALGAAVIAGGSLTVGPTEGKPEVVQDVKAPTPEKPVEPSAKKELEKEPTVAWGKEVGGLQAGLSFKAGEKRVYSHGDSAKFVVKVRNVDKVPARVEYTTIPTLGTPLTVANAAGETQPVRGYMVANHVIHHRPVLKPGEELEIPRDWNLLFESPKEIPANEFSKKAFTLYGTGKFSAHVQLLAMSADDTLTELGQLATGMLELEVEETPVAWGKVVGGLQAGLSFKAGEKRVYSHGEKVTLVIRVRNVGKEEGQVRSINTYPLEEPPTVTDAAGKTYPIQAQHSFTNRFPIQLAVAPGKEIELNQLKLELRPAQEGAEKQPTTLYGAGKLLVQFPTVGTDPAMNKLATGKLELEVQEEPKKPEVKRPKPPWGGSGPLPLTAAEGTTFTFARVRATDGKLCWTDTVFTRKVVPKAIEVEENGVMTTKIVDNFVTNTESKKLELELGEFDIANGKGEAVASDELAKRLKDGGALILLRNPLDDVTRKWFGDDALFFMPLRGKGEDRGALRDIKKGWSQLGHQTGNPVTVLGVQAKGGMLSWTERVASARVVTEFENGVPVTRTVGSEEKPEAKELKLSELKITGATGEEVAAAEIEKRLKDGGVLVRSSFSLSLADRKLFYKDCLFLEPTYPGWKEQADFKK